MTSSISSSIPILTTPTKEPSLSSTNGPPEWFYIQIFTITKWKHFKCRWIGWQDCWTREIPESPLVGLCPLPFSLVQIIVSTVVSSNPHSSPNIVSKCACRNRLSDSGIHSSALSLPIPATITRWPPKWGILQWLLNLAGWMNWLNLIRRGNSIKPGVWSARFH